MATEPLAAAALFIMIGAEPHTDDITARGMIAEPNEHGGPVVCWTMDGYALANRRGHRRIRPAQQVRELGRVRHLLVPAAVARRHPTLR